jgi:hypothetical protein
MALSMWQRKPHVGREDRRNEVRAACEGEVVVDVLSPHAQTAVQARIVDVGESSVKLSIPFHLSPGSLVRIHMTDSLAYGEARYCTCEGAEYFVGVKIDEIVPKGS